MRLENTSGLTELCEAARLQVWSLANKLTEERFTPFQIAYFFERIADAALAVAERHIRENQLQTMMVETRPQHHADIAPPAPEVKTPVKRTRKKLCEECGEPKTTRHVCGMPD